MGTPLKIRHVTPRLNAALADLATGGNATPCAGKGWLYADLDLENLPTPAEAELMCTGCPILNLCFELGMAEPSATGVYGGVVFVDGKPQTVGRKLVA